jgi:hypothetical protein
MKKWTANHATAGDPASWRSTPGTFATKAGIMVEQGEHPRGHSGARKPGGGMPEEGTERARSGHDDPETKPPNLQNSLPEAVDLTGQFANPHLDQSLQLLLELAALCVD